MEQLSNALAISSLILGLAMRRSNKTDIAQFLESPSAPPIKYPNVARIIVEWIESCRWGDLRGTVEQAWKQMIKAGDGERVIQPNAAHLE